MLATSWYSGNPPQAVQQRRKEKILHLPSLQNISANSGSIKKVHIRDSKITSDALILCREYWDNS